QGNCVKIGNDLHVILKYVYTKGARGASSCKMKMKNLSTGGMSETVYRASDKFDLVVLERKKMQYLYTDGDRYTFMDQETYEQMDLNRDDLGDAIDFLMEQMIIDVIVHGEKAVGVELPKQVDVEITYTEPAVKGDTGGKVLKAAKVNTGIEVQVPLYCNIGDKIKVDTDTYEFVSRAN
ncbi:MAG: elongation factor P, partial [Chitinispirillia bacterium]|nr:elongation factor P [Chitinispirillia bacterium]MCL2267680.1 elongation factor P [Chitinispirillia bacterium]